MNAAALLLLVGIARAVEGPSEEYRLGTGDVLTIEVAGTELGGTFVVGTGGAVSFPYCERVVLGGKTVFEAESAMRECLMDGVVNDPQIVVRVEEFKSQRVEVSGAIEKAGMQYLHGETTLRALIGQAGGVKSGAIGTVIVTRGEERFSVAILDLGGPAGSMAIQPGDVVSVDQGRVVLVDGVGVSKPGALAYTDGMTVREALARAGGATGLANLSASYVLRDGEKISVNLRKVLRGKASDLVLQPGDQLVVPESPL